MPNVVVVGAQWGDEGKGKVVDALTASADVVVRFGGGANAGHTLMVGDRRLVVHLLPSGVIHTGKRCLLGPGMVVDPEGLLEEIDGCRSLGLEVGPGSVGVSERAHVIFPYHKTLDQIRDQGDGAIGTTKRGIGPCYEDKMARRGLQMWQIQDGSSLRRGLERVKGALDAQLVAGGSAPLDLDSLVERFHALGSRLAPYLCDVSREVDTEMKRGARVLFEGAQGALLDIDHGTYPFVTSSSTVAGGACCGVGIGPTRIDEVVGIVKAYQTRVGNGPFPSELEDEVGARLREGGQEYGATTGRPRRCGWLDVAALRHAVRVSGITRLAVTKLDVLKGISPLRICTGYRLAGAELDAPPPSAEAWQEMIPVYEEIPGFEEDISKARVLDTLPAAANAYLRYISDFVGVPISMVSVGPRRDETITVENLLDGC